MTPDYHTPPGILPNQEEVNNAIYERERLQAEYNALTADDVEWTAEGEARCNWLEMRIEELDREVKYMTEGV